MRLENILQFIKIKELNHNLLHIHTLELSNHIFLSNNFKDILKTSSRDVIFDNIISSVTTPHLKKLKLYIRNFWLLNCLSRIPESIDELELIVYYGGLENNLSTLNKTVKKIAIKNVVLKVFSCSPVNAILKDYITVKEKLTLDL